METLQQLRQQAQEFGLVIFTGHEYWSAKDEVDDEVCRWVVVRKDRIPEGQSIIGCYHSSSGTDLVFSDQSRINSWDEEGVFWSSDSEESVLEEAVADLQKAQYRAEIHSVLEWTAHNRPDWLESVLNRPSGSRWGITPNWQELAEQPWVKLPKEEHLPGIHMPQCEYHFLDGPYAILSKATQNIRLLSSFKKEELDQVELAQGHGWQLQSPNIEPRPTRKAWLIIGPAETVNGVKILDQKMVLTAYPGEITGSLTVFQSEIDFSDPKAVLQLWRASRDEGIPLAVKAV